ncbi:transporter [Amycolatopsis antarctica]|uniref:PH-like domain-containing protein n=1 Tax=Amycolatopsis antarctica TaxID=1854586 RepID=UPI001F0AF0C8|nr:transporter [Amycolatopsis antarctica]
MDRFLLSLAVLAFFALCVFGMWRGWRRQARAQSVEFPPFPEVPTEPGPVSLELPGLYVASTRAGHWQERIVTRGAGLRTSGTLRLHPDGIEVERIGAPGFWIPRSAVVAVATGRGMAGKVMGTDALLVITWRPGEGTAGPVEVDTGFRADDIGRYRAWIDAVPVPGPVAAHTREAGGTGEAGEGTGSSGDENSGEGQR